jgi:hypothetical protein
MGIRDRARRARRKNGVLQPERSEDPTPEVVFDGVAGDLLDDEPEGHRIGIRVVVAGTGSEVRRVSVRDRQKLVG